MKRNIRRQRASKRGFSAIELAAVASIIAILALILIPIVRTRLETARQTAAVDDMRTIEVAQTLANADTAQTYRLCDLDNPRADLDLFALTTATVAQKEQAVRSVPNGTWNKPFSSAEQADATKLGLIGALWNGPYTTFNKTKFLPTSALLANPQFRVVDIDSLPANTTAGTGPMPIFQSSSTAGGAPPNDGSPPFNDDLDNNEHWPIDPWGSPYIYFGTGRMGVAAGDTANTAASVLETNWGVGAIYSTGPDGYPGNNNVPAPADWFREAGILGTQDDLYRFF